jgi:threonine synthase
MYATHLECINCSRKFPLSSGPFICPDCGEEFVGPVRVIIGVEEVIYDFTGFPLSREELTARSDRSIWKFREFLPVRDPKNIVSLGEGGTPLLHTRNLSQYWGAKNIYVKNESSNPTGSFKDRETSVMISMAREFGVKAVTITSSGNAGGAVAAYANAACMDAYCFVPVSFSPSGKRSGYIAYNPTALIGMHGFYEEISAIAIELGLRRGWYITNHGFNPYRMEGDKTIAYELCMDLGWRAPHNVIVPTGSGGNLAGEWKGFKELYELGWIDSLPKMTAIQVEAGAPLVKAFERGLDKAIPDLEAGESIADGVVSIYDDYAVQALQTIRESGGTAITVSDKEILKAERLLAKKEGIFVEPSSAVAVAGAQKLIEQGTIEPEELAVIITTATGLKNPDLMLDGFTYPLELDVSPNAIEEIEAFLRKQESSR